MKPRLTPSQRERNRKHKQIIRLWKLLKEDNPRISNNSAYTAIAWDLKMSISGVRKVVENHNKILSCAMDG